jgi:hypothetical protein
MMVIALVMHLVTSMIECTSVDSQDDGDCACDASCHKYDRMY